MSNNKQSSVEWLHVEFQKRFPKETYEMYNNNQLLYEQMIQQAKAMHKEETEAKYQEGREIGKIEVLTSQSTKNASEYSQGYNKGFLAALEYMNSTIENKIKLRQYEQQ